MLSNQRARPVAAALAALLMGLVPLGAGEIDWDAVRAELDLGRPLRWENVTPAGRWAGGVRPRYRPTRGCHTVSLERGESTTALVLPGEHLAVYRWGDPLDPKLWKVSVSDGSGLFLEVDWSPRSRPDRLLLEARGWRARFVRISRPPATTSRAERREATPKARSPEELGLFVLSRERLPTVSPFARELRPQGTSVSVRREDEAVGETFFLAGGGRTVSLPAAGVRRLLVITRLLYPESESRLSQRYRVVLETGDRADRHGQATDLATNAEFLRRVFVDGKESVVGEERTVIFDVPRGATEARLGGDLPFYFRALAETDGVYLLPRLNAPASIEEARERWESELAGKSRDLLSKLAPGWLEAKNEQPWADLERAAKRMALRNDLLDAPLRARRALESVARAFGDSPSIWRSAADLDDRGRIFIDLYPRDGTPTSARREGNRAAYGRAFFSLDEPTGRNREHLVVGEQHVSDLFGRLGSGAFSSLAPGRPLRYDLPRSASPGRLRVVFLRETETPFRRTIRVRLRAGSGGGEAERTLLFAPDEKPCRLLRPSLGAAGLGILRGESDRLLAAPGAAGWRRGGAPLVPADGIEIDVPQGIRSVELRLEEEASDADFDADPLSACPLRVAVEARITTSRMLTEMEYAGAARRVEAGLGVERWFRECLRRRTRAGTAASPAEFLLWSHWTPLLGRLEEHARSFRGGTPEENEPRRQRRGSSGSEKPVTRSALADVDRLLGEAAEAESRGQLLLALELWGRGGRAARAQGRGEWAVADLARARILRQLGEVYLAEAVLRDVLASDALHARWREALEDLGNIYREGSEDFALERLYGYAALERPGRDTFTELARTLREVGETDESLAIALALEDRYRPLEPLLAGSLHNRWWATFERALQALPGEGARAWWRGQERLVRGRFDEARSAFSRAGPHGEPWVRALQEARAIREELASSDLASRARALLRWEAWMSEIPGPRLWETDESLVREHDGAMRVESIASGRGATYFRAAPGRPVRMAILGPANLEIEGRPLHRAGDEILDGWLRIEEGEWMRPVPIAENAPSPGLAIAGRPSLRPGTSVEARIRLGPGLHELEIEGSLPLLVRPLVERPEFPPAALPPLTVSTAQDAIAGRLFVPPGVEAETPGEDAVILRVLSPGSRAAPSRTARPARPTPTALFETAVDLRSLDPELALRVGIRLGLGDSVRLPEAARLPEPWHASGLSSEERLWLVSHAGKLGEAADHPRRYGVEEIPIEILEGVLLSRGEVERLCGLPLGTAPGALEQRFADLVFVAENITEHAKQAVCEGERLYRNHAVNRRIRSLYTRLVRDFTWSRLLEMEGGIRRVPIEGWAPESETMRIRKGFLSPLEAHEQLLAGDRRLVLRLPGERSRVLRIELALAELEVVEPRPVEVWYQVVPEEAGHVWLTKDSPSATVNLALPTGEREVKVWLRAPEPYRYVKTGFVEIRPDEDGNDTLVPLVETTRREYLVATRKQPVVFEIDGPAWLRIDELRDGRTESSYRLVRGRERISLLPRGEDPALFRVFERAESSERMRTRGREPSRTVDPPPRVPGPLPAAGSIHVAPLGDETREGTLRSETWSLAVRALRRRALEEDLEGKPKPDEFLELGVTHRFRADSLGAHFRTKLLGRVHADGGPGFALEERIRIEPPGWRGIAFHLRGETHSQWPAGSTAEPEGSLEWSAGARARVSQVRKIREGLAHMPSAEVFGRTFSIDEGTTEAALVTDQDVFTFYKNRHRAGLRLAETLFYQPWLDTHVSARVSLATNESFDPVAPDHASFRVAVRQMLGSFELGGDFRLTHYFDDADRSDSVRRHIIGLSLARDFWLAPSRRIEIAGGYTFDVEQTDSSFFIQVVLHLGGGRSGYRDFAPGEPTFRGLSRRLMFRALED